MHSGRPFSDGATANAMLTVSAMGPSIVSLHSAQVSRVELHMYRKGRSRAQRFDKAPRIFVGLAISFATLSVFAADLLLSEAWLQTRVLSLDPWSRWSELRSG